MLGAIIGDVVGSRFEWHNCRSKDFSLFTKNCFPTDDSIMTLAIAKSLLNYSDMDDLSNKVVKNMQELGKKYPDAGYGCGFYNWIDSKDPQPYNSYGNGAGMRVSPVAYVAKTLEEVKQLSNAVTRVTHNHKEGLKGAEAIAVAIFMARNKYPKEEIEKLIKQEYYHIDFTLDEIRDIYDFDETCQGSVPQALQAFFESTSFEDAIRNAISIGGDSDTIADMTGSIAEAYYGIPDKIKEQVMTFLDEDLKEIVLEFNKKFNV